MTERIATITKKTYKESSCWQVDLLHTDVAESLRIQDAVKGLWLWRHFQDTVVLAGHRHSLAKCQLTSQNIDTILASWICLGVRLCLHVLEPNDKSRIKSSAESQGKSSTSQGFWALKKTFKHLLCWAPPASTPVRTTCPTSPTSRCSSGAYSEYDTGISKLLKLPTLEKVQIKLTCNFWPIQTFR